MNENSHPVVFEVLLFDHGKGGGNAENYER